MAKDDFGFIPDVNEDNRAPAATTDPRALAEMSVLNNTKNGSGSLEAAGIGAADAGTLGFRDELMGAIKSGALSGPEYEAKRNESRAYSEQLKQNNPKSYLGGQLAGMAGTALAGGELLAPLSTAAKSAGLLTRISAGAADAASIGAVAGAGNSNANTASEVAQSALEGAETGAKWGGAFSTLAHGLPALTEAAGELPIGQRIGKAYNQTRATNMMPGSAEDIAAAGNQMQEAEQQVASTLQHNIGNKLEPSARAKLQNVAQEFTNIQRGSQAQSGAQIGEIVDELIQSEKGANIGDTLTDVVNRIDQGVEAGLFDESKVRGLKAQVMKLKETAAPESVTTEVTNNTKLNPETGEVLGQSKSYKLGGKETTLEELQAKKLASDNVSPGRASITQTQYPESSSIKEVQQEILSQAAQPRDTVSVPEIVKLRNLVQKGLENTDPSVRKLYQETYRDITGALEEQIINPEVKQAYKDLRQTYSKSLSLGDLVTELGPNGQPRPASRLVNLLEGSNKVASTAKGTELNDVIKLVNELSESNPGKARALMAEAKAAAGDLGQLQGILKKYTESPVLVPGTDGTVPAYPNIRSGIISLNKPATEASSSAGQELMGSLTKASPDAAAEMQPKLNALSDRLDLANVASNDKGMLHLSPTSTLLGSVRQIPVKVGGLAAKTANKIAGIETGFAEGAAKVTDPIRMLTGATKEVWAEQAQKAAQMGKIYLGKVMGAVAGKDNVARNATLFLISQDKNLKQDLHEVTNDLGFTPDETP